MWVQSIFLSIRKMVHIHSGPSAGPPGDWFNSVINNKAPHASHRRTRIVNDHCKLRQRKHNPIDVQLQQIAPLRVDLVKQISRLCVKFRLNTSWGCFRVPGYAISL